MAPHRDFPDWIAELRRRTRLPATEPAVAAIRACLHTLAEVLASRDALHLLDKLPWEVGQYLMSPPGGHGETFEEHEFLERVADREGVDRGQAELHARAVLALLRESLPPPDFGRLSRALPRELRALFDTVEKPAPASL